VVAAVLVETIGVIALAPLALVILVPQAALERIAGGASAAYLNRSEAIRLYSAAIADVLEVPRAERRQLACAADIVAPSTDPLETPGLAWRRHEDASEAVLLALHARERWAGNGWPAGLPAEAIPPGTRLL